LNGSALETVEIPVMTTFAKFAAIVGVAGLSFGVGHSPASATDSVLLSVTPYKAINLASGSKRAIGYYVADAGSCQLTLQLADKYSDYANTVSEPVRVKMIVREGTSARIDSLVGPTLDFKCAMGAGSMSVMPVEHTAHFAGAK